MDHDGTVPDIRVLVDRHLDVLYRFACRLTGHTSDAEDLVQETFLIAHQKLHQLHNSGNALPWLFKVLRSCWSKRCQQRSREVPIAETVPVEEISSASVDPIDLPDAMDSARLLAVLDEMPDEFREPLLLFYFQEFRYREIAEIVDCPIGTVMSRLARGKAYLRNRLAPETIDRRPS
jgi:RNA polymerase sigma-70 factor (ECF subfamily)